MTPGEPYRRWFHDHVSRNHYSLGEATDHYNDWLVDPQYGPEPPPRYTPHNRSNTPVLPPVQHQTNAPPDPPTSDQDYNDHSLNSAPNRYTRVQTIVQDLHTSPDDANAVLDSGAMMTTAPRRHLTINPQHPHCPSRDSDPLRKHGNRARRRGITHRLISLFHCPQSLPNRPSLCARHCLRRARSHIHQPRNNNQRRGRCLYPPHPPHPGI